jgi:hypothetical protein
MMVWIARDESKARLLPQQTIASTNKVSSSGIHEWRVR